MKKSIQLLKSSNVVDWHIVGTTTIGRHDQFLNIFKKYLADNNVKRQVSTGRKRWHQLKYNKHVQPKLIDVTDTNRVIWPVIVGLRSCIRALERRQLRAAWIDTAALNPSAIASLIGIVAIASGVDVYAVAHMSDRLRDQLAMPSVNAIGLLIKDGQGDELCAAARQLLDQPVSMSELTNRKRKLAVAPVQTITKVGSGTRKRRRKSKRSN